MPHLRGKWLNYEWAVAISLLGILMTVSSIAIAAIVYDRVNPFTIGIIGSIGASLPALIAALKATETADSAAKTTRIVSFTASKIAAFEQLAEACPNDDCPMKHMTGQT